MAALGDSHPRTKNAFKAMADFLARLDIFLWLSESRTRAGVMELGKSNIEFHCKLAGIDLKAGGSSGPTLKLLQDERRPSISKDETMVALTAIQQDCCYLADLQNRYRSATTDQQRR